MTVTYTLSSPKELFRDWGVVSRLSRETTPVVSRGRETTNKLAKQLQNSRNNWSCFASREPQLTDGTARRHCNHVLALDFAETLFVR